MKGRVKSNGVCGTTNFRASGRKRQSAPLVAKIYSSGMDEEAVVSVLINFLRDDPRKETARTRVQETIPGREEDADQITAVLCALSE